MAGSDLSSLSTVAAQDTGFRLWRWVFAFGFGIVVLGSYLVIARWNLARFANGLRPITLETALDRRIPFVPEAFWIYICYYLIAISPAWLARRWGDMVPMAIAYGTASVLGFIGWIILPVRMINAPLTCSGATCRILLQFIDADGGVNVFPSMHVAHSVLAGLFHLRHRSRAAPLVVAGATAVAASTVMIRQHYIVDIPAGVGVAAIGWWVAELTSAQPTQLARVRQR
jgi:hypothetical protein